MKEYIFSLPSLIEVIKVADDQGLPEAREAAAVIGSSFVTTLGVVKEATAEDIKALTLWGTTITDPKGPGKYLGKAMSMEPTLNGADNIWLGASLGKRITPEYDGNFMFGTSLFSSLSGNRDAFWDIGDMVSKDSVKVSHF